MKKSIANTKLSEVLDEVFFENQEDKDIHYHCFYSKLHWERKKKKGDKAKKEAKRLKHFIHRYVIFYIKNLKLGNI